MSSVDMRIKTWERKYKDLVSQFQMWEQCFIVIPYTPSGYVDYSNFGEITTQQQIDQFETYKRLWTGNDAFIIQWRKSISFENDDNPNYDYVEKIKLNFQVGEAMLGWLESNSTSNEISTDTSFSEYKSQKSINNVTIRIPSFYDWTDNHTYCFYKLPEYSNQTLYKVDSVEKEYIGRDLMCYVVTFSSLQDELANTGRAKDQNVMPNGPGQGYLRPLIQKTKEVDLTNLVEGKDYLTLPDKNRIVTVDSTYVQNNPVCYVVVKAFGFAIISNITFIGRRAQLRGDFRDYGVPRLIFPMNFSTATTTTLYRTQQEETNYYWCFGFNPQLVFNSSIFDKAQKFLNFANFYDMQGYISVNEDTTKATNPIVQNSYGYQLFGQKTSEGVFKQWTITPTKTYTFNTSFTLGCASSYSISQTGRVIHDLMWDSYWTQKQMKTLPLTPRNSMNFGWCVGAAYASFVAKNIFNGIFLLLIGIVGSLVANNPVPTFQGFMGMIPCSMFDFMVDESQSTLSQLVNNEKLIRLNYFLNSEAVNDAKSFYRTDTMNTSFQAELTDCFVKDGKTYTTDMIGQKTDSSGNNLFTDGRLLLMSGGETLKSIRDTNPNEGWIIDSFNLQAIFQGDFSIEFLDVNKEVIWYGVYQSEAKWTGSIREINTWKDTSIFGRENRYTGKPLKWPESLQVLNPDYTVSSINLSLNKSLQDWAMSTYAMERIKYPLWTDGTSFYYANADANRFVQLGYYDKVTFNSSAVSGANGVLTAGDKQKRTGKEILSNIGFTTIQSFLDFYSKNEIVIKHSIFTEAYQVDQTNYSADVKKGDYWQSKTFTNQKWTISNTLDNGAQVTEWVETTLTNSFNKPIGDTYKTNYVGPQIGVDPGQYKIAISGQQGFWYLRPYYDLVFQDPPLGDVYTDISKVSPKAIYNNLILNSTDTFRMRLRNEKGVVMLEWEFQPNKLEFAPQNNNFNPTNNFSPKYSKGLVYFGGYGIISIGAVSESSTSFPKPVAIRECAFSTCKSIKLSTIKFST